MKSLKKITTFLLLTATAVSCLGGCSSASSNHLQRDDWAQDVKDAVNDFIDIYGNKSDNYSENSYVVSDFDNTAAVFDVCEQLMVYQAEVMAYAFTPQQLPTILASGLGDMNKDLTYLGYGKGSYNDWIEDITTAYSHLYETYGPFTPEGVDDETAQTIQSDNMWPEFAAKLINMYHFIGENESTDVSYPWTTYWFTGMTEQEVYNLAKRSHEKYGQVETSYQTIKTSDEISSNTGVSEYTYVEGIAVTENTKELWKKLSDAGIDVWICTASQCDIVRAAVDVFGLHDYCTGLMGMTPVVENGKIGYTYDYENGCCWYADKGGGWHKGEVATGTLTQGEGKVTAIKNICVSQYGCGPIAGFMDSTGDFNFCTEFDSLKLVICFNRADRKVTDGGGLIAALAIYQRDELGYNLEMANANGDTFYVLQGRDENGLRTLRNSNKTIKLGESTEKLFRDESNEALYRYISENKMTTCDIINTFAVPTAESSENNLLGFTYGFAEDYGGYHSIK